MALGATAHPADVLDRLNRHEIFRFWWELRRSKSRRRRQCRSYCGIVENDNSGIAGGAVFFSIPESSKVRIPQRLRLQMMWQEPETLNLTTLASYRMMEADGR
jgi:hypothetical protein